MNKQEEYNNVKVSNYKKMRSQQINNNYGNNMFGNKRDDDYNNYNNNYCYSTLNNFWEMRKLKNMNRLEEIRN